MNKNPNLYFNQLARIFLNQNQKVAFAVFASTPMMTTNKYFFHKTQHIEGALHKQRIQQSKFNNDILKLATKYNSKNINNHKSTKIA